MLDEIESYVRESRLDAEILDVETGVFPFDE
jgi:hypothetical protein